LADPKAIAGPVSDMIAVSHNVKGMPHEELVDAADCFYCVFLLRLLHHGDINLAVALVQPTSSQMISHHLSTSFPTVE
jgi:hypothetical protein